MRKITLIVILFLLLVINTSLFSFVDIGINISPNSDGLLEGSGNISIGWFSWLRSYFGYSSSSFISTTTNQYQTSTIISDRKEIYLKPIELRASGIYHLVNVSFLERYVNPYIGFVVRGVNMFERENGVYNDGSTNFYFYQDKREISYIKPLINFGGNLNVGILSITFEGDITPISVSEAMRGDTITSTNNQRFTSQLQDEGFESRYYGGIKLRYEKYGSLNLGVEYFRHIGWSKKVLNVTVLKYAYELINWKYSLGVDLEFLRLLFENIPIISIGVSYIDYNFNPYSKYNKVVSSVKNSRFSFDVGVKY